MSLAAWDLVDFFSFSWPVSWIFRPCSADVHRANCFLPTAEVQERLRDMFDVCCVPGLFCV